MRILFVATKAPWPPVDGGRLLLAGTLEALAAAGHHAALVAPVDPERFDLAEVAAALAPWCEPHLVPARPAGTAVALARSRLAGLPGLLGIPRPLLAWLPGSPPAGPPPLQPAGEASGQAPGQSAGKVSGQSSGTAPSRLAAVPLTVARHAIPAVRREVLRLAAGGGFDVAHAEQLQALPQLAGAGLPVVLRAQNVESDLWGATSRRRGGWRGSLLAGEARRLAAWEGAAVRGADATVALSVEDAGRLTELAGLLTGMGGDAPPPRVQVVPPPFPARLPPGRTSLFGDPPVVVLGSPGWLPNEDSAAWFLSQVWPGVRAALPGAVLHLFGMEAGASDAGRGTAAGSLATARSGAPAPAPDQGVVRHPAPADSAEAFPARAILAVPLRIASGVRMKILEAWARGVPVVGTPEAVAGLGARHGRELLVAQDPGELAAAIARLDREPALARSLTAAGRAALAARHDPARIAGRLAEVYAEAAARRRLPAK